MIVGLSGWARAGKDSVGRVLIARHGFERVSFADKVREVALAIDPYIHTASVYEHPTIERLTSVVDRCGWETAKAFKDARRLLQRIGTEAGRNVLGEDIWVRAAFRDLQPDKDYVVTDARFWNEASAIVDLGGQVWRVTRPGHRPANQHPSEIALDGWNFDSTINNAGSLRDLEEVVATHIASIKRRSHERTS